MYEFTGRALLTPRKREVLARIAAGDSYKEAGRRLGISPRTIEVHRARAGETARTGGLSISDRAAPFDVRARARH